MTSSHMCIRGSAHVFLCKKLIFTSSGFEHAHFETNSPHIDVAHVTHAEIDARYIAGNCSCIILLKLS